MLFRCCEKRRVYPGSLRAMRVQLASDRLPQAQPGPDEPWQRPPHCRCAMASAAVDNGQKVRVTHDY